MMLRSGSFERGPDRADHVGSIGRDTGGRAAESLERGELRISGIVERKSDEAGLRVSGVGEAERGERNERELGSVGHEVRFQRNLTTRKGRELLDKRRHALGQNLRADSR